MCFTFFIIFDKNAFFNVFYFLERFYFLTCFYFLERFLFSSGEIAYPIKLAKVLLNLLNSCIKRLLSEGFNIAAMKISS